MSDVVLEVEVRVVDPVGVIEVQRYEGQPLARARREVQPARDVLQEVFVADASARSAVDGSYRLMPPEMRRDRCGTPVDEGGVHSAELAHDWALLDSPADHHCTRGQGYRNVPRTHGGSHARRCPSDQVDRARAASPEPPPGAHARHFPSRLRRLGGDVSETARAGGARRGGSVCLPPGRARARSLGRGARRARPSVAEGHARALLFHLEGRRRDAAPRPRRPRPARLPRARGALLARVRGRGQGRHQRAPGALPRGGPLPDPRPRRSRPATAGLGLHGGAARRGGSVPPPRRGTRLSRAHVRLPRRRAGAAGHGRALPRRPGRGADGPAEARRLFIGVPEPALARRSQWLASPGHHDPRGAERSIPRIVSTSRRYAPWVCGWTSARPWRR